MEYIRGDIKIEFEHIGEGWSGDYDPDDPDDVRLLRFTVYKIDFGEWSPIDDASYCTMLPVDTPKKSLHKALKLIMDIIYFDATTGHSIKKKSEALSWLSPDVFEEVN